MEQAERRSIFVIGDSVSIHYGPYLKKMTEYKFNYDRKRGLEQALKDLDKPVGANAGDSRMVLDYLTQEYHKNTKYDILLLNCGLHDIRVDRYSNQIQVDIEEYKSNLAKIIEISKRMSNKTVWVAITPIVDEIHNSRKEGFLRYSRDAEDYDNSAKEVMKENNIPCVDLYSFTMALGKNIYFDHVHFKDEIRKLQAAFIAGYLYSI